MSPSAPATTSDHAAPPRADIVILGRAGSRGLPGKNAVDLAGRPMIAWTIDAARAATCARRIVCSTDGAEIAAAARAEADAAAEAGDATTIEVIERPAELAGDTAAVADAARHAVVTAGLDAEFIVILYANVPLRPAGLIDAAVRRLAAGGDSVQSYTDPGKHHPWWMVEVGADGRVLPQRERVPDRRQDLPALRIPDGGVIAVRRSCLQGARAVAEGGHPHDFLGRDRRGIETPAGTVVDVDDAADLAVAAARIAGDDGRATLFGRDLAPAATDVFVIAEIGVNHDGDAGRAGELSLAALEAGADAVKFQHFVPERLMSRAARLAAYQAAAGEVDPIEMLRRLTLPLDALLGVAEQVRRAGGRVILTLFSPGDAEALGEADQTSVPVDAWKTASPDLLNLPLLRPLLEAARTGGRPLIQSTGAASAAEVMRAAQRLDAAHAEAVLMHCVSAYPVPDDEAGLAGLAAMRRITRRAVGYSDHTGAEDTGALAVAAGARLLEKHVTFDRTAEGPDHAASLEPDAFARYAAAARRARRMLGDETKRVHPREEDVRSASRQSVVLTGPRPAGHRLTAGDLDVKRPGTGIPAEASARLVGRTLARPVVGDEPLVWDDLAPSGTA